MQPESLLSYYPTYSILDEVVSLSNCDTLNIFIDLKNNLQTLYMKEPILAIIESSSKSKFVDSSIISSVLAFLAFHKMYSVKRGNLKVNFYIFFESGISYYHTNISKKYKINRRIDDLYGLDKDKRDYFFSILQKNFILLEKVCKVIPSVNIIRLQNLEADFIPYYLIRNNMVPNGANLIYSNDHDLLQCLSLPGKNYVFSKSFKSKKLIKKGEVLSSYLKISESYSDDYLTLIMSVIGDSGDNVDGISGIGSKRVLEVLNDLIELTGGMENLRNNVINGNYIFNSTPQKNSNKYLSKIIQSEESNKTISNNLKLVDFEVISTFVDNPITTEMVEKKKSILESLNKPRIVPISKLKTALEMVGVYLQEELETIYYPINGVNDG